MLLKSTGESEVAHALLLCYPTSTQPPPCAYSTVVSGTQRLFSGSQSSAEWQTTALHGPKSLHDFLIGGSGLYVQRLESGPHCQSSTSRRDQIFPRLNLRPVKAVRHGGSGWVASEGEREGERQGWQWKRAVFS